MTLGHVQSESLRFPTKYLLTSLQVNENNPCARDKWSHDHAVSTIRCIHGKFSTRVMAFKGMDSMDGEKWGGLTKENVFFNALNSWKANG